MAQSNMKRSAAEIKVEIFAQTDIGVVRKGNEDNFLIADLASATACRLTANSADTDNQLAAPVDLTASQQGLLFAVADGMGGALAGEVASEMAVRNVRELMLKLITGEQFANLPFCEKLRGAIEEASRRIFQASESNVAYTGMGSTFTAAAIDGQTAYLAQVGDSRCYLIRNNEIHLLTRDQSVVNQLIDIGLLTPEEAETHPMRNVILQALGVQPSVNVVVEKMTIFHDDMLLLCSDGLTGKVRAPELLDIISSASDLKEAADDMIALANKRGGEDNITVVIAHFTGTALPPAKSGALDKELILRTEPIIIDFEAVDTAPLPEFTAPADLAADLPHETAELVSQPTAAHALPATGPTAAKKSLLVRLFSRWLSAWRMLFRLQV